MLNLHFKEFFQTKACSLRRKRLRFAHFFILIYAYNLLNINAQKQGLQIKHVETCLICNYIEL